MRVFLDFGPGGYRTGGPVNRTGVETPHGTITVARNEDIIVIKIPGYRYWSGRGESKYAAAEFEVYRVEPGHILGDKGVWANRVLDFPVRPRQ